MSPADIIAREPLNELIYQALRFAYWAAGEGLRPVDDEAADGPEDFLFAYSQATGDEDWETLADRVSAYRLVKPDHVQIPANEEEAAGMAIIGERWLQEHAPHRLRAYDARTVEACEKAARASLDPSRFVLTGPAGIIMQAAAAIRKLAGGGT